MKLPEAYNAYKHGYRLLFAKDEKNNIDVVPFIDRNGSLDHVTVDSDSIEVFQIMIHNHNIKQELVSNNKQSKSVEILFLEKDSANYKLQSRSLNVEVKAHGNRITYLGRPWHTFLVLNH